MAAFGLDIEEVLKASKPNAARTYLRTHVRIPYIIVLHIHIKYLSIIHVHAIVHVIFVQHEFFKSYTLL